MNDDANGKPEKTVALINRAVYLPGEGGYKRTMFLFDMMRRMGHRPILVTSDFNHYKKEVRDVGTFKAAHPDYGDIVFLHTRAYAKNVSLRRRAAENDWRVAVTRWVEGHKDSLDAVMMAMPDMNTILAVSGICKANGIEMIVDVRDLRPEVFKVLLGDGWLYRLLTGPMKRRADAAYACADKLVAVSEEYLARGSVPGSHAKVRKTVYIGAVLDKFDEGVRKYSPGIAKPDDELWLTYAGTLGSTYDIATAIDAVHRLKDKTYSGKRLRLMVLGQGPDRSAFEEHAKAIGADNVTFTGFLDYERMAAYLVKSDMTLNAVKRRASQSIINKTADYFAAGIPMLNGCLCREQRDMVDTFRTGVNYEPENSADLAEKIDLLAGNPGLRAEMGKNARKLAEEKFDRNKTYRELIDLIYS
jgi:glycosyltransferase involved in cell wall biosynthesis